MSRHLSDGQLRAACDGELSPSERQHLEGCPACRERQGTLQAQVDPAARKLAFLAPAPEDPGPQPGAALARFYEQRGGAPVPGRQGESLVQRLFAPGVVRFGLAAALVLALVLAIPTTRGLAGQFLSLFRVQQVAVLPLDLTGLQQLAGNETLAMDITELLSRSVTVTEKPGDVVAVADADEASVRAGFPVRLPPGMTPSRIYVEPGAAFRLQVDRAKAQAVLDAAGRQDLVLPDSIDGTEVSVDIPAGVSVSYGTCPEIKGDGSELELDSGSTAYADCMILAEFPSPTVQAPEGIDIDQLAQIGLEFSGMSAEQAEAFVQTVDWTSTLVVPIPRNAATYRTVTVDGVAGTLIQAPTDASPQFALVWVKGGVIYAIGGMGDNAGQAVQMANSLP